MTTEHPTDDALEHQHRRLLDLFTFIARETKAGDTAQSDAVWDVAVAALERHMAEEERRFPPLRDLTPEQAEILGQLRADHERMRTCLAELGVTVQLRSASPGTLADLVAAVRTHATREESTFFRWLEAPASEPLDPSPASAAFVGSTLGACVGAVGGMVMSPLGMLCGAVIGATLGRAAGEALDAEEERPSPPLPAGLASVDANLSGFQAVGGPRRPEDELRVGEDVGRSLRDEHELSG